MSAKVGISVIGTPDGFESVSIGASKNINLGPRIDLDNSVISILPGTEIMTVRRDVEAARLLTFVTFYRFAKEIKTSRTGSFYGVSIFFENFIPDQFKNISNLLLRLADMVRKSCIDPAENRFLTHLRQEWLLNLEAADPLLLDPRRYQKKAQVCRANISTRKCFISLEDSLGYEDFLFQVLKCDRSGASLTHHHLVYASRQQEVLREVQARGGLEVEALGSLSGNYQREGNRAQRLPEAGLSGRAGEESYIDLIGKEVSSRPRIRKRADRAQYQPLPSGGEGVYDRGAGSSDASRGDDRRGVNGRVRSRINIPIESAGGPLPHGHTDGAISDATWRIAMAIDRRFPHAERNALVVVLLSAVAAGAVAMVLLSPVGSAAWSYIFGGDSSLPKGIIYYVGCVNSAAGAGDSAEREEKCAPDLVANKIFSQLKDCPEYKGYLRELRDSDGEIAKEDYQDSIKRQINLQIAKHVVSSRASNNPSLSREKSTPFVIDLDFKNGERCMDWIAARGGPDYSKTPPQTDFPKAAPPVVAKPPSEKQEDRASARPAPSSTRPAPPAPPRATPTPRRTAQPANSSEGNRDDAVTQSPKQEGTTTQATQPAAQQSSKEKTEAGPTNATTQPGNNNSAQTKPKPDAKGAAPKVGAPKKTKKGLERL